MVKHAPIHILEVSQGENSWIPPEISSFELVAQARQEADKIHFDEYLYIFRTEPYVDSLYVKFDNEGNPITTKRFTIHEGYRWTLDNEQFFYNKCINSSLCGYSGGQLDSVFKSYSKMHSEWHIQRYYAKGLRLLDHLYNCSKENTAKEILYKSGLDELAADVYSIDDLNLLSSKPSEIYDGLSTRVLRSLNCAEGAVLLRDAKTRSFLKDLNMKFPDIFKKRLNDAQCKYLRFLIQGKLVVGEVGRLFNSRLDELAYIWNQSMYEIFISKEKKNQERENLREELIQIDPFYAEYLSDAEDMDDINVDLLKYLLLDKRESMDKAIRRANRKRDYDWQERGEEYVVRYPQTINDFCREAVYMRNCLLTYVEALTQNDTTILFMRRSDNINRPFITLEVYDGELMQAYHRFNEDCTPQEAKWIREYCERHDISFERYKFDSNVDELF